MRVILAAAALLASLATARAEHVLSESGRLEIDSYLQGAVESGGIPGFVAIVANRDRLMYCEAHGKREVANDVEMREDDFFQLFSMEKPIVAVAIMMLCEDGKLDLDGPISKYVPTQQDPKVITSYDKTNEKYTSKPVQAKITIRRLLNHTSGYTYSWLNETIHELEQKTGKPPRQLPLLHEPGTRWAYSGVGYDHLFGELVEAVTGSSLKVFCQSRIFDPLGMDNTFYVIPEEQWHRFVSYRVRKNGALRESAKPKRCPSKGLYSTAGDYVTFLQMLLNRGTLNGKTLLSESSVDRMTQNQIGKLVVELQAGGNPSFCRPFPLGAGHDKFGLGFQITASCEHGSDFRSPGSYSWGGFANTHFWVDPKKEIVAVIMMHVMPYYDEACIAVLRGFEERVYRNLR